MAPPPNPISPSQAAANIKKRRDEDLKKAAKTGIGIEIGNPNLIADPNNPLWKISFLHIATGNAVALPGWITSFSDNLASTWNEETVYGRMDPLVTFQRTQRTISTSFDVIASNKAAAMANSDLVDLLMDLLYPVYNGAGYEHSNTLKAAPLMKVKWANLITTSSGDGLVGYIDGFAYQPDFASGFFLEGGNMFPQLLRLNFNLKVIHTDFPGHAPDEGNRWSVMPVRHGDGGLGDPTEAQVVVGHSAINTSELEVQKRQLLQTHAQEKLVLQNVNRDFTAQGGHPPRRGPKWHRARKRALEQYRTNPSAFSNLWGE